MEDELDAPSLSRISLRWMVQQCLNAETNIQLDEANLDLVALVDKSIAQMIRNTPETVNIEDIIAVLKTIKNLNPAPASPIRPSVIGIGITVSPSDDDDGQCYFHTQIRVG